MTSATGGHVTRTGAATRQSAAASGGQRTRDHQDNLGVRRRGPVELALPVEPGSAEERVVDAMFACIGRWGLTKTTVEDVARTAGISRATVYRLFPGGKSAILQAGLATEVSRLVSSLSSELERLDDLESCLARAVSVASRFLGDHAALAYVREHEWTAVESFLAYDRLEALFLLAGAALGPSLIRFVDPERASRMAMWSARLVVSYLLTPSDDIDLGDEATARRIVTTYLLPAPVA